MVPSRSLESVCEVIVDCPHSTPTWTDAGPVVLRSQGIRGGRLDLTKCSHTDEAHFRQRIKRAVPRGGDIVITREAPMGQVCMIPEGLRCCLGQRMVLLRPDPRLVDARYLMFTLQSPGVQHEILSHEGTGSTVSNLRIPALRALPVPCAPLPEQRAIAHILGTLDDKIELNRRMAQTLEAIARAIFKSWFVDFDPVRAKAEGRDTGLPKEISDLFPDRLVESEIGQVPEGWGVGPVLAHAALMSGGTPKTDQPDYWNGPIDWASAKDVSLADSSFLVGTQRTITERGLAESAAQLIPALATVVIARGATTGRMVILGREMAMNQTCYALKSTVGAPFALFHQLLSMVAGFVQAAHGSVFDTITTRTFEGSLAVLPPDAAQRRFDALVSPLMLRSLSCVEESRTLATLRDTLLPKLISGELRVPDAMLEVEEATA